MQQPVEMIRRVCVYCGSSDGADPRYREAAGELGAGLAARTDADGDYVLGAMAAGAYTLNVEADATTRQANITVPATRDRTYDMQL